jgi:hypothetical protein
MAEAEKTRRAHARPCRVADDWPGKAGLTLVRLWFGHRVRQLGRAGAGRAGQGQWLVDREVAGLAVWWWAARKNGRREVVGRLEDLARKRFGLSKCFSFLLVFFSNPKLIQI